MNRIALVVAALAAITLVIDYARSYQPEFSSERLITALDIKSCPARGGKVVLADGMTFCEWRLR